MLRNKTIWPALLAIFFLVLLPSASAQLTLSSTEAQPGDTITFSGSIQSMSCSGTNANFRILLKRPDGSYVQSDSIIFFNQKYTNQHPNNGCMCQKTVGTPTNRRIIRYICAPVTDVGYNFDGSIQISESAREAPSPRPSP